MASGSYLVVFTAMDNMAPAANFATLDARNLHPVLDFDDTTDQNGIFLSVLPPTYSGGGLTVDIHWTSTSATSGTCRWAVSFERIGTSQDIDSDSFAAEQTAGTTAPGTAGVPVVTSIPFTDGAQMDSIAVGEAYRVKIKRDADGTSGTDNMTGDAEVLRVVIKET